MTHFVLVVMLTQLFFLAYGRVCRQGQQQCKIHSRGVAEVAEEVLEILEFLALY